MDYLFGIQCRCSHSAIATTKLNPYSPLVVRNKSGVPVALSEELCKIFKSKTVAIEPCEKHFIVEPVIDGHLQFTAKESDGVAALMYLNCTANY